MKILKIVLHHRSILFWDLRQFSPGASLLVLFSSFVVFISSLSELLASLPELFSSLIALCADRTGLFASSTRVLALSVEQIGTLPMFNKSRVGLLTECAVILGVAAADYVNHAPVWGLADGRDYSHYGPSSLLDDVLRNHKQLVIHFWLTPSGCLCLGVD
ncbi:MAG: hypothetical protein KZQ75_01850 [Candidatus Thiodiazotropha sp. (ex Myrtea spinifera)]|nr:hypothetical protein [Candidatus Thiodiazotropha sp. (ex Myrtea spinifera)]MCU7830795.1 hypothetical protein [Candidatus Thiodiazotropha sp. (ex Myrtea sp. 'scaly one' KF741663)]